MSRNNAHITSHQLDNLNLAVGATREGDVLVGQSDDAVDVVGRLEVVQQLASVHPVDEDAVLESKNDAGIGHANSLDGFQGRYLEALPLPMLVPQQ